jgi:hypothetical protein
MRMNEAWDESVQDSRRDTFGKLSAGAGVTKHGACERTEMSVPVLKCFPCAAMLGLVACIGIYSGVPLGRQPAAAGQPLN